MDLLTLAGTLWRHKLAVIPVIVVTVLAMFYIVVVEPPTYKATASVLLVNPPSAPTSQQIAADPALGRLNTNNPYNSLNNLDYVADVLIEVVTAPAAKQQIVASGAGPDYSAALDASLGSPPAIDVTGSANNAQVAVQSARIVAAAVSKDLHQLQAAQNVNPKYMISAIEYVVPTSATSSSSSKLRTLIGVVAVGVVLLFVAVSLAEAFASRKRTPRRKKREAPRRDGFQEPVNDYRNGDIHGGGSPRRGQTSEPQLPSDWEQEARPVAGNRYASWDQ